MWRQVMAFAKTFLVAVLAVFCAVVVRAICHTVFNETVPYTPFYPAIVAATMYGRLPGGLIATVFATFAASLWLPPFGHPGLEEPTDLIGLFLFLLVSGLVVALCEAMRRAQQSAELDADQERRAVERERAARVEAEEANRLKDQFLASVSHELRTPLQSILGWVHLLREDGISPSDRREGLAVIERNARAQSRLIEDLLDMSRIVAGKMRLSPAVINPEQVIDAAVQTVMLAAQAKRIAIVKHCDKTGTALWADPDRLQQIVWNLLSNAIKFSPAETTVEIALRSTPKSVAIEVADEGEGIDSAFLPHVFDRFRQADMSTSRRHGGLGLGLSIVKHLVELHGGQIEAASPGPGRGTRMTAFFPVYERLPPVLSHGDERRDGNELHGVRVLVVDDDVATGELIARILREQHSEVVAVSGVSAALEALSGFEPDVVVSDIAMPERDGYELMREIRSRTRDPKSQIRGLALTALSSLSDQRRSFEAGYRLHLTKPIDPRALTEAVAELAAR